MPAKKYQKQSVTLSLQEKDLLRSIVKTGSHKARTITRARILLLKDSGLANLAIRQQLDVGKTTPWNIIRLYTEGGLNRALYDAPRSGQPPKLTAEDKAKITALACTDPPDGYGRWTLDLLETAVASKVKAVSRQTVYNVLLASDLKPWREKNVVYQKN